MTHVANGTIRYSIDGKTASSEEYKVFIQNLLPERYAEYCEETNEGGGIGYQLKDKNGNFFQVREHTVNDNSSFSVQPIQKNR